MTRHESNNEFTTNTSEGASFKLNQAIKGWLNGDIEKTIYNIDKLERIITHVKEQIKEELYQNLRRK